jgi:hypothetical protein
MILLGNMVNYRLKITRLLLGIKVMFQWLIPCRPALSIECRRRGLNEEKLIQSIETQ